MLPVSTANPVMVADTAGEIVAVAHPIVASAIADSTVRTFFIRPSPDPRCAPS